VSEEASGLHAIKAWRERRAAEASRVGLRCGEGYLYRAGELLIRADAEDHLADVVDQLQGRPDVVGNEHLARLGIGLRRWLFPRTTDIPTVVAMVRKQFADLPAGPPIVSPNHGFSGEPFYHGGPGSFPRLARALPGSPRTSHPDGPVNLAVLDTGIPARLRDWHAELADSLRPDSDDIDALDQDGDGVLDFQAGHGTFICGLVRRLAPRLVIDPEQVLDSFGFGSDLGLARALVTSDAPVVNLSLGGYTEADQPPPATAAALRLLRQRRPESVVVAAAGNHDDARPFWPAASDGVLAVAAADTTGPKPVPAAFSNYGAWVDFCAPGVDLHAPYIRGRRQDENGSGPTDFIGWASWSGTSFAAPLVAAFIAAKVANGGNGPNVVAQMLASLSRLPDHPDYGRFFDPGIDLCVG